MVIENYVDFGIPLADLALQYGELFAMSLSGSGILALFKKNQINSGGSPVF